MSKEYETYLENGAYDISSRIFSFKELKRSVIEHGKNCFIEGYKNHKQLFKNYLIKQGYFSKEEILKIYDDFETHLMAPPDLSIETAEKYLATYEIGKYVDCKWIKEYSPKLTEPQKNILKLYQGLTNDVNILRIQKPRQKGVSTILEIIAQIEAKNDKKVLYCGYGPLKYRVHLKKLKNLDYKVVSYTDEISEKDLRGQRYDLIIFDEITTNERPEETCQLLDFALNENGRLIVVGTPCKNTMANYKKLKDFFKGVVNKELFVRIKGYCIDPTDEDYKCVEKYPESRNELLGEFLD